MNIAAAAPNIIRVVMPTMIRDGHELGWPCINLRSEAATRMPTSRNGASTHMRDPVSVKRESAGKDDEVHHDVGEKRSNANIEFAQAQFTARCAKPIGEHSAAHGLFFFYFLRGLPEKQVRTDCRSEAVTPGSSAETKQRRRPVSVRCATAFISVLGSEQGIERLDCSLFRERMRKVKQFCVQRFLFSDDVREGRRGDLSPLHADENPSFTSQ